MTTSAFGVEHGEISKAGFPSMKMPGSFSSLGSSIGNKTTKVGTNLRRTGAQNMAIGRNMKGPMGTQTAFGRGMQRGGAKRVRAGGMVRSAGQSMQRSPGRTGAGVVGGAAAAGGGGGYTAYAMNRNRQQR